MIGRLEKGYILPGQMDVIYGYKEILSKLSKKSSIMMSTIEVKSDF